MPSKSSGSSTERLDSEAVLRLADQAEAMNVNDPRRIKASLAMFERLCEHWSLRGDERETLLGGIPKSTWSEWRKRPNFARIKSDTRERIANLFTIDLFSHSLFAPEFADRWIRERNAALEGNSPLSMMLRGKLEDVITVRRYLERIASSAPSGIHSSDQVPAEKLVVSKLPGDAFESDDNAALRHAAAIYERLADREPARYQPVLAAALTTLATSLEERNDAEAELVFRRAVEILHQVASEQPADEVMIADLGFAAEGRWRTDLTSGAAYSMTRIAMFDASFSKALLARLVEIQREPFAYPASSEVSNVHIAHMMQRGVSWMLAFVISEALRRITIIAILPQQPEATEDARPRA